MKSVFVQTENAARFGDICGELESPESLIGPSLAMTYGPAGRGKSEAAKHYAANSGAIYIPPLNKRTPLMLLREVSFELSLLKPGRIEACVDLITDEMQKERRLVIIDEADLLPISILEMIRNINERCLCPVLLIGEQELKNKIASRRRLASRIRRSMEFGPVTQPDIVLFFRKSLEADLTASPDATSRLHKSSRGDWRPLLTVAIDIERAARANGLKDIPIDLILGVLDGR